MAGGDVQIGNAARQRMMTELDQVTKWNARMKDTNTRMRSTLKSNSVAVQYQEDYDFGKKLIGDFVGVSVNLDSVVAQITKMVQTTQAYVAKQAEYNS